MTRAAYILMSIFENIKVLDASILLERPSHFNDNVFKHGYKQNLKTCICLQTSANFSSYPVLIIAAIKRTKLISRSWYPILMLPI